MVKEQLHLSQPRRNEHGLNHFGPQSSGFTLIEIALVLVVVGLLITGGLQLLQPVQQRAQISETEAKLDYIEDALVLYGIQNGCLPCPADATPGANTAGVQQTTGGGDIAGACNGATACFSGNQGVVPWVTLNIAHEDVTDAWGTLVSYYLSTSAADATGVGTFCENFQNTINANDAAAGGFRRTGTTFPDGCLDVEDATPDAGYVSVTDDAAYVLISHGPDTSGGFDAQTTSARVNARGAANGVQAENNDGTCDGGANTPCHQDSPVASADNDATDDFFDDIVRWKSGPLLVFQCGSGDCGNP